MNKSLRLSNRLLVPLCIFIFSGFLIWNPPPGLDNPQAIGPFINNNFPSTPPETSINLVPVYSAIQWESPIVALPFPGTDKMLVVEMDGRFFTLDDNDNATTRQLVMNMQGQTWYYDWSGAGTKHGGIQNAAFHPDFGKGIGKDYLYVYYIVDTSVDDVNTGYYERLSRFTWENNAFVGSSELIMINQYDTSRGHDGSGMAFGNDGFLYVGVGDEGTQNAEATAHTQKINDRFRSGVWRLDVDQIGGSTSHPIERQPNSSNVPAGGTPSYTQGYYIPNDNPWGNSNGANLEEFYAIGLRQPFRMTVDPPTGNFWIGDVGGGQREEIDFMDQPGLNFQWNYKEGTANGFSDKPTNLIGTERTPIHEYDRTVGRAVIGGYVYRGSQIPQLTGKYLFSDNTTGVIYSLTHISGNTSGGVEEIAEVPGVSGVFNGISSFGYKHDNELLILKLGAGTLGEGKIFRIAIGPTSNEVTFYKNCEFNANEGALGAGDYADITQFGLSNNSLSSIKIPDGLQVTLYENTNFGGASIVLTSDANCLTDNGFNDKASSIKVVDLTSNEATFYSHCNFDQAQATLSVGEYSDVSQVNITNDNLSSVKIPAGLQVTLYENTNFGGASIVLTSDASCLTDNGFNDKASSIKVVDLTSNEATFYSHCNFDQAQATLSVGEYSDVSQVNITNDNLSSVKIPAGLQVTLYENTNFGGASIVLTSDASCLTDNGFNDKASSIKIERISSSNSSGMPLKLSQTGIFANLSNLTPNAGIIPYDVNTPLWSAGTVKKRWIAIPNDGTIDSAAERIDYSDIGNWNFPVGTVLIKQFDNPNGQKLETRVWIHAEGGDWYGATYKWQANGLDADLLLEGAEEDITIDGETFSYLYPSTTQCATCHNSTAGYVLGFRTSQLNRNIYYPTTGKIGNQLETLTKLGFIPSTTPSLSSVSISNNNETLEIRARSYLDANCAHCHQPTVNRAVFDARLSTPFTNQNMLDGTLIDDLGIVGAKVLTAQDIDKSAIYTRMNTTEGCCAMPPLAKGRIDKEAVQLVANWINNLQADCGETTSIQLGNDLSDGNFIDAHFPSLNINKTDIYTNTSGSPEKICIVDFSFYARREGNPVTPFIAKVNSNNNFTILAVGQTRAALQYNVGNNTFAFTDHSENVLVLQPGETIAPGFMDANADGSNGKIQSVIPAQSGTGQDGNWQTFTTNSKYPSLTLGNSPGLAASIAANLSRSYKFHIGLSIESANSANYIDHIAIGKPASQSSTGFQGVASRAVDGNAHGVYNEGSITHTQNQANSWWKVDLEAVYDLSLIKIHNRTDCCSERLIGASLYAGNTNSTNPSDYTLVGSLNNVTVNSFTNLNISAQYIMVRHAGTQILSLAEVEVQGTACVAVNLPAKIEAEDFCDMKGVQAESTGDTGGGENIGFVTTGDYMDYQIRVAEAGTYKVDYRVAAQNASGGIIQLQLNGNNLSSISIPSTGAWQTYTTVSNEIDLPQGTHTLRVFAQQAGWNLNWLAFEAINNSGSGSGNATTESCTGGTLLTYGNGAITMEGGSYYQVFDINWKEVFNCGWQCGNSQTVDNLAAGDYRVFIKNDVYQNICERIITISSISDGGNFDNDGDGIPTSQDCDDNNPNLTTIGSTCNDGNSNTENDVVQGNCTCAGTPINTGGSGNTITCGEIAIVYGNGVVTFTGLPNKDYFFKINDLNNGWAVAGSCGWNCGHQFTVDNLANSRYLLTVYNDDWSKHCDIEIIMTSSNIVAGAESRAAAHLSFAAYQASRTVELQWLSNSGFKVSDYEAEHSSDGENFNTISRFVNKEWSEDIVSHQINDESPKTGSNYYRVKEIYLDGSFSYTDVQKVEFTIDLEGISIFPNPAQEELFINLKLLESKKGQLTLVNQLGHIVYSIDLEEAKDTILKVNTSQFANGLYYLNLLSPKQKAFTKKILIHRLY